MLVERRLIDLDLVAELMWRPLIVIWEKYVP